MTYVPDNPPPDVPEEIVAPDVPEEIEETLGEELRDTFLKLMPKMVVGKQEHSDESLELSLSALLDEIDDELLDVLGWGVIARRKVNVLRGVIKILEQRVDEMHNYRMNPVYLRDAAAGKVRYVEAGPMWLSIESAPKDGTTVLLWSPGCPRAVSHWYNDLEGKGGWMFYGIYTPTHWHPLPDPPDGSLDQGSKK